MKRTLFFNFPKKNKMNCENVAWLSFSNKINYVLSSIGKKSKYNFLRYNSLKFCSRKNIIYLSKYKKIEKKSHEVKYLKLCFTYINSSFKIFSL